MDPNWTQLGEIVQAGESNLKHAIDDLGFFPHDSSTPSQGTAISSTQNELPAYSFVDAGIAFQNVPLGTVHQNYDNKSNLPAAEPDAGNPFQTSEKPLITNGNLAPPENQENIPVQSVFGTHPNNAGIAQASWVNPSDFRMVTLSEMNLNRPLEIGDEVHLLNDNRSDLFGEVTYKITSISDGLCHIVPVPTTLRCPVSRLVRAPLQEGDIVSVFQSMIHTINGVQEIRNEQADWGAITKRYVVNGERRYNVVSWDERYVGRMWEGMSDAELGQYDIEEKFVKDVGIAG